MLSIAICDDYPDERDIITLYLQALSAERKTEFAIKEYDCGEALLASFSSGKFDLIFLDIFMKQTSGLETARRIRDTDEKCAIVFTTSSKEYALESYDVNALYYLVKPLTLDNISYVFSKYEKLYGAPDKYLEFTANRILTRVFFKDILYFEVLGHKTKIYCIGCVYSVNKPLIEIERKLDRHSFLRCHRCFIINMQHISQVAEDYFILFDGSHILITLKDKIKIKQQFADFCFRKPGEQPARGMF